MNTDTLYEGGDLNRERISETENSGGSSERSKVRDEAKTVKPRPNFINKNIYRMEQIKCRVETLTEESHDINLLNTSQ